MKKKYSDYMVDLPSAGLAYILKKNTEEVTCEYYFPNKKVVFGHFYVCCCICLEAYINKKNPLIILLCAKQYFCTVSVTVENRFIPTQLWLPNYHVAG
jgi:hypothetical protein